MQPPLLAQLRATRAPQQRVQLLQRLERAQLVPPVLTPQVRQVQQARQALLPPPLVQAQPPRPQVAQQRRPLLPLQVAQQLRPLLPPQAPFPPPPPPARALLHQEGQLLQAAPRCARPRYFTFTVTAAAQAQPPALTAPPGRARSPPVRKPSALTYSSCAASVARRPCSVSSCTSGTRSSENRRAPPK